MAWKVWDEITDPFPTELISNFTQHFMMDVIIYPYWNKG